MQQAPTKYQQRQTANRIISQHAQLPARDASGILNQLLTHRNVSSHSCIVGMNSNSRQCSCSHPASSSCQYGAFSLLAGKPIRHGYSQSAFQRLLVKPQDRQRRLTCTHSCLLPLLQPRPRWSASCSQHGGPGPLQMWLHESATWRQIQLQSASCRVECHLQDDADPGVNDMSCMM
jgi:hypothetical protein